MVQAEGRVSEKAHGRERAQRGQGHKVEVRG
jgi:hypothetical protein